jgi:DNA-binding CsgD family transcriptional regulator
MVVLHVELPLTAREMSVLQLIGLGKTTKEIASHLNLSPQTVSDYRKGICRKLDLHTTAGLAAFASSLRTRGSSPT